MEFFAVITNHKRVENPRDLKEAIAEIERYLESENLLKIYPKEDTLSKRSNWQENVTSKLIKYLTPSWQRL